MPKKPKMVKRPALPVDPFADIEEWPSRWMEVEADRKTGHGMLKPFTAFIQSLIDGGLTAKTIRRHVDHLFLLGGEIIRRIQDEDELRQLPAKDLILEYVEDEGGPLLSFWDPNDETDLARHMAYDATCRKLYKFLTAKSTLPDQ
jgi:hypothetical protein